ncbi:MAG: hypothetical protein Q4G28_01345 [Neisseria sp.]|nr:hypothetical protein [Neisseria sp.]
MSPKQLTLIVIRLLLLYSALQFLGALLSAFVAPPSFDSDGALWQYVALFAILAVAWVAVFGLLWKLSPKIAAWLLPERLATPEPMPQNPMLWLNAALVLMGIWLLATSLGTLLVGLYRLVYWQMASSFAFAMSALTADIIRALIGLLLCLKPLWFSRWIRKVIS